MTNVEKTPLSERAIQNLEAHIPEVAAGATYAAYVQALAAGHVVLRVEGSNVVESNAEGIVRIVGKSKPRHKVAVGAIIKVRRLTQNA